MASGGAFGEANHAIEPTMPDGKAQSPERSLRDHIQLAVSSVLLILAASGQAVSFKSVGYSMKPYPYFILLSVSWSFVPILFALVLYIHVFSGGFEQTQTTLKFKIKFIVIGAFNAANGVLVIFSNPYVGGVLQTMLLQSAIPFTMAFSAACLKARYNWTHYVGVLLILAGILIYITPDLKDGKSVAGDSELKWVLVFLFSQVPQALQSVYQEAAFRDCKCNVVYMMAWSSLAQAICLLLCAPINFIPGIVDSSEPFLQVLADGAKCAVNRIDGCEHAGYLLACCVATMLLTNLMQAYVVKIASASFSVVLITLVTPVSAVAFTIRFIMGSHAESLTPITWLALVVLLLGVLVFRTPASVFQSILAGAGGSAHPTTPATPEHLLAPPQEPAAPRFMSSRLGIISSEYTAEGGDARGLLFECTRKPMAGSLGKAACSSLPGTQGQKLDDPLMGHSV